MINNNFTKLINDEESFKYFNSLSNKTLENILDDTFNFIDDNINHCADTFKILFDGADYDEYFYLCKCLSEELNNIKIIINILRSR